MRFAGLFARQIYKNQRGPPTTLVFAADHSDALNNLPVAEVVKTFVVVDPTDPKLTHTFRYV